MNSIAKRATSKAGAKAASQGLKKAGRGIAGKALASVNPLECIKDIVQSYSQYRTVVEQETTKRRGIVAMERTELAKIAATREILMTFLDQSFDERRKVFHALFLALDSSVEVGNIQALSATLVAIVHLSETSPFKHISSVGDVTNMLKDTGSSFEL